jgi:iron(III) transport system substrate-binding protein
MTARRGPAAPRVARVGLPIAAAVLAVGLAACGSSGGGNGGSGGNTDYDSMSTSQLATAAAKEGSLTWYTTFSDDDVAPMIKAFNKLYPKVHVDALRLSADQIPPRVITEQRGQKYNVDVISGDSPQLAQLIQAGAMQAYTPKDQGSLPPGLSLQKGYEGVVYINTTVIAYNPTALKQQHLPVPTSWQDLTKPVYAGKFSIDPTAVNWYDSLVKDMGHAAALKLLKGLGANKPQFVESHTDAITDAQAGEPPIAATAYGYKSADEKAKAKTDNLAFFNANPLPSSLNLVDLAKNAPHPAAARLFLDWIVSKEGQKAVVDITNHTSVRSDVGNDASVWNPAKWKPAFGDPNLSGEEYNSEATELKTALNAP